MYLLVGSYWFDQNEADISISKRTNYTNLVPQNVVHTWNVKGKKHAASQSALTTALIALEAAVRDGQDIGLYLDDQATLTAHYLVNSRALGGNRIVEPVHYPLGDGGKDAQYSTYRDWAFTLEATYAISDRAMISFEETIEFEGDGGPRTVWLETAIGLPQEQTVSQFTSYKAIQSGSAKQLGSYPTYPGPIWPDAEKRPMRKLVPKANSGASQEFEVRWTYYFESALALRGNPHIRL